MLWPCSTESATPHATEAIRYKLSGNRTPWAAAPDKATAPRKQYPKTKQEESNMKKHYVKSLKEHLPNGDWKKGKLVNRRNAAEWAKSL